MISFFLACAKICLVVSTKVRAMAAVASLSIDRPYSNSSFFRSGVEGSNFDAQEKQKNVKHSLICRRKSERSCRALPSPVS